MDKTLRTLVWRCLLILVLLAAGIVLISMYAALKDQPLENDEPRSCSEVSEGYVFDSVVKFADSCENVAETFATSPQCVTAVDGITFYDCTNSTVKALTFSAATKLQVTCC